MRSLKSWIRRWQTRYLNSARSSAEPWKPRHRKATARGRLAVLPLEDRTVPSHFRFGTIDWSPSPTNPNQISFHLTQSWRRDIFTPLPNVGSVVSNVSTFAFGDSGTGSTANINLTVTSVNTPKTGSSASGPRPTPMQALATSPPLWLVVPGSRL